MSLSWKLLEVIQDHPNKLPMKNTDSIIKVILLLLFLVSAPMSRSALQFLSDIYANYNDSVSKFNPCDFGADSIFSPELLYLIRFDQRYTKGEEGYMNWDPLCDCLNGRGLKLEGISLVDSLLYRIDLNFPYGKKEIILVLSSFYGDFRITNVYTKTVMDLYGYIRDALIESRMNRIFFESDWLDWPEWSEWSEWSDWPEWSKWKTEMEK
jgi:hypothetical protein